jgi:hypothetical protein
MDRAEGRFRLLAGMKLSQQVQLSGLCYGGILRLANRPAIRVGPTWPSRNLRVVVEQSSLKKVPKCSQRPNPVADNLSNGQHGYG